MKNMKNFTNTSFEDVNKETTKLYSNSSEYKEFINMRDIEQYHKVRQLLDIDNMNYEELKDLDFIGFDRIPTHLEINGLLIPNDETLKRWSLKYSKENEKNESSILTFSQFVNESKKVVKKDTSNERHLKSRRLVK